MLGQEGKAFCSKAPDVHTFPFRSCAILFLSHGQPFCDAII
jgi:hypothetical protein